MNIISRISLEIDRRVSIGFVVIMAFILVLSFSGVSLAVETTSSMYPVLERGDVIIFKKVEATEIRIGDIIIYQSSGSKIPIAHRVVGILPNYEGFRTKGDAVPYVDPEIIKPEQIKGKCIMFKGKPLVIPKIGLIKYPQEATQALYKYLVEKKTELITTKTRLKSDLKRKKEQLIFFFRILRYHLY